MTNDNYGSTPSSLPYHYRVRAMVIQHHDGYVVDLIVVDSTLPATDRSYLLKVRR